jgi:hypothetical protein
MLNLLLRDWNPGIADFGEERPCSMFGVRAARIINLNAGNTHRMLPPVSDWAGRYGD